MLLFPPNPNVGDTFTGPNGQMWAWDGVKWSNLLSNVPIVPTVQAFTSGTGTYTPPSGVQWIRVRMCGGGGGGGGASTTSAGNAGVNGGPTTFGAWTCAGGAAGNAGSGGTGGTGGTNGFGTLIMRRQGGSGAYNGSIGGTSGLVSPGIGMGGVNFFGSAARTANAVPNTGAGGAGGGSSTASAIMGIGGGAGEYVEFIAPPSGPTPYAIGAGGAAGTNATGPGSSGVILVEENYR